MTEKGGPGGDLRQELNQLWKTTVDQFDEIKDVIMKSSHAGKARLDIELLGQKRSQRLRELGEVVMKSSDRAAFPPAWREVMDQIDGLDREIAAHRDEFETLVKDVKEEFVGPDSEAGEPSAPAEPKPEGTPGVAAAEDDRDEPTRSSRAMKREVEASEPNLNDTRRDRAMRREPAPDPARSEGEEQD